MKRLELLIELARAQSQNVRFDSDSGIPQKIFVQYFQNAQDSLLKEVMNAKTKFWLKEKIYNVVSGQEQYSYPDDIYMTNIDTVEWSTNNLTYFDLQKAITKERLTARIGYAYGYIPRHDGFIITPPLDAGYLRVTYLSRPNNIGKRSGKITAVTFVGSNLTSLSVDLNGAEYDLSEINNQNYLCVVDKFGTKKATNIQYDSCTAGVFSSPSYTLASGESITVGDYIVVGKNMTNVFEWPDICESYLLKHAIYEAKYGDSSMWSKEQKSDMVAERATLLTSFYMNSDDTAGIPITSADYLDIW